ncbi:hypothetical protein C4K17_2624 [Pseudomonas chlororaphis subsp. aurantiaca]|nr:hypothetical protein C4K17_2624 [Pseudomonas chlororaphis subsp. aurantiaca]
MEESDSGSLGKGVALADVQFLQSSQALFDRKLKHSRDSAPNWNLQ